jgi:hypothetical protein
MIEVEVRLPASADLKGKEHAIVGVCETRGLELTMKTSLKGYPGSTHWHFKKGSERGTIELTFWKAKRRLWINVHSNREGSWTTREVPALKAALENAFR